MWRASGISEGGKCDFEPTPSRNLHASGGRLIAIDEAPNLHRPAQPTVNWNRSLLVVAAALWFGVLTTQLVTATRAGTPFPSTQTTAAAAAPGQLPPGYAGTDSCALCHEEQAKNIEHSRHGQAKNPRTPAG